jgi:hypothetical protein
MNLTVKNLHKSDFAPYICCSENALGKGDARIRLQGEGETDILMRSKINSKQLDFNMKAVSEHEKFVISLQKLLVRVELQLESLLNYFLEKCSRRERTK